MRIGVVNNIEKWKGIESDFEKADQILLSIENGQTYNSELKGLIDRPNVASEISTCEFDQSKENSILQEFLLRTTPSIVSLAESVSGSSIHIVPDEISMNNKNEHIINNSTEILEIGD